MGIANLRRLAADHAMLHSTELPPCYFFPSFGPVSSLDDLTQLTILLTGPTGTPYSQGLWRLSLKIPDTYPEAPPRATFRTRIWHPNVDENTGSVCVDTLKKDWQPNLNLRDVLITIYCLLIQPNPDSALNASAGHLLQDDYDSFARQARLMTSIHGSIPPDLKDLALSARRRGEIVRTSIGKDITQSQTLKSKSGCPYTRPPMGKPPDGVTPAQSARNTLDQSLENENSPNEDGYSICVSKENDPLLSQSPVPVPSPRRPSSAKRPLSDLHIIEPEYDMTNAPGLSPSDQNVVNNVLPPSILAAPDGSQKTLQLTKKSQSVYNAGHNQETEGSSTSSDDLEVKPIKRVRPGSGKENMLETWEESKALDIPLRGIYAATEIELPSLRKALASNPLGTRGRAKGKSRVGLRRL